MMDWLDKIAPEPTDLEAIRDADPERGELLESVGGLKPREDRTAAIDYLARQCEEWEEARSVERPFCKPQHAKVDLPDELRLPKRSKSESRRHAESDGKLPWNRKAPGEDAFFEAERAAS